MSRSSLRTRSLGGTSPGKALESTGLRQAQSLRPPQRRSRDAAAGGRGRSPPAQGRCRGPGPRTSWTSPGTCQGAEQPRDFPRGRDRKPVDGGRRGLRPPGYRFQPQAHVTSRPRGDSHRARCRLCPCSERCQPCSFSAKGPSAAWHEVRGARLPASYTYTPGWGVRPRQGRPGGVRDFGRDISALKPARRAKGPECPGLGSAKGSVGREEGLVAAPEHGSSVGAGTPSNACRS